MIPPLQQRDVEYRPSPYDSAGVIAQKILLMAKYSPRLIHRLGDGAQDLSDDGLLEQASAGAVRNARRVPSQ